MRIALALAFGWAATGPAHADEALEPPTPAAMRYTEDWSAWCDAGRPAPPGKCIGIGAARLSLGAEIRLRGEAVERPGFGLLGDEDRVLLQRLLVHGDLRWGETTRVFVQLAQAAATDRERASPSTDRNEVDLAQGFVEFDGAGGLARVGRQEVAFGSARLVGTRDGPNSRRSFDGVRLQARSRWGVTDGFVLYPVSIRPHAFDDRRDGSVRFAGVHHSRAIGDSATWDLYVFDYRDAEGALGRAVGPEERVSVGTRWAGQRQGLDWDVEAVWQGGDYGPQRIRAWTASVHAGYTFESPWRPRLGLKADVASGDADPLDGSVETFNPLFPKLPYFTEAGLIAPANLMDVHPTITVTPVDGLDITLGWNALWRHRAGDAYYTTPLRPVAVPESAGRRIGSQSHVDVEWSPAAGWSIGGSYVAFQPSHGFRTNGARSGRFVMAYLQYKY